MTSIFVTLGPSTLTSNFLSNIPSSVDLLRLNMSHMSVADMTDWIYKIRQHTQVPICIDTEGAQIRTCVPESRAYLANESVVLLRQELTPIQVWPQLKAGDYLAVGFDGLQIKVLDIDEQRLVARCISAGKIDTNKGVHCNNHNVTLPDLTDKDLEAIKRARELNINTFALSFTRDHRAVESFQKMLPDCRLIYKIETQTALDDLDLMFKKGKEFLIDRGDLGKDIGAEQTPVAQRKIMQYRYNTAGSRVYVATNFLESMVFRPEPTRAEISDIYSTLEQGADGLVLASETAIGKFPVECIEQVEKVIKVYQANSH